MLCIFINKYIIYALDQANNKIIIVAFILIKYKDANSLIVIFRILHSMYSFEPITINTNFEFSQIKAIKGVDTFKKHP